MIIARKTVGNVKLFVENLKFRREQTASAGIFLSIYSNHLSQFGWGFYAKLPGRMPGEFYEKDGFFPPAL